MGRGKFASGRREFSPLRQKLAHLDRAQVVAWLGEQGEQHLQRAADWDIDLDEQVYLSDELFRVMFPVLREDGRPTRRKIIVAVTLHPRTNELTWTCSPTTPAQQAQYLGAAFSVVLREKAALGLVMPSHEPGNGREPLSEQQLIEQALAERVERARTEKFQIISKDPKDPWTDYSVKNPASGRTYRVALRGLECGSSYCSCPDFRTNTLGTCKHVIAVTDRVTQQFTAERLAVPFEPTAMACHLKYGLDVELWFQRPRELPPEIEALVKPLEGHPIGNAKSLLATVRRVERLGGTITIFPDAEEYIQQQLAVERMEGLAAEVRRDPASHPLRTTLLKTELLPYQLDGIAFAAGRGRAILADEMGLGKTIQGIGVAELLAREAGIERVLIVCPASLKSQWKGEIERFGDRPAQLVAGSGAERAAQYENGAFFTICNYEQVLRDLGGIERAGWDLIILDEAQRIKNWQAKTSRVVKGLQSRYALVLTGTPLENRLDDLFCIVDFVDGRRLGPAFRFFNRHRVVDEKGKVLGYQHLGELRERLAPVLLRRTRKTVQQQLPARAMSYVRVPATEGQLAIHAQHMLTVSTIVRKKFLTDMDLLRLQKSLLMCRLAADSAVLADPEAAPESSKLERLAEMLDELFVEEDRKAIVFSEWTGMLDLVEPLLLERKLAFVRLDGQVPQQLRQALVDRFQTDPECRLFLTTNAGSTGLNLQAANTVLNLDLPWNPAVLEQRIARAHRMGQERPVQVYLFVTEGTLEERLLATLAAKEDLALAALDVESDVEEVQLVSGLEELRQRLERLIEPMEAPADDRPSFRDDTDPSPPPSTPGHALATAFVGFVQQLSQALPATDPAAEQRAAALVHGQLARWVHTNDAGQPELHVPLPDPQLIDQLAQAAGKWLASLTPPEERRG